MGVNQRPLTPSPRSSAFLDSNACKAMVFNVVSNLDCSRSCLSLCLIGSKPSLSLARHLSARSRACLRPTLCKLPSPISLRWPAIVYLKNQLLPSLRLFSHRPPPSQCFPVGSDLIAVAGILFKALILHMPFIPPFCPPFVERCSDRL